MKPLIYTLIVQRYKRFYCVGTSMLPILRPGDELWGEPVNLGDLAVGDVIAFREKQSKNSVVHRVIRIRHGAVFTQGDNCSREDNAALNDKDILGRINYLRRGKRLQPIGNRRKWCFSRRVNSISRVIRLIVSPLAQAMANSLANIPHTRKIFRLVCRPVVIRLGSDQESAEKLLIRGRVVGFRRSGNSGWEIKRLYLPFLADGNWGDR